jgi:tryptophan synthase alpha chain
MSRIETTFKEIKMQQRAALITYIAAGDPDTELSGRILAGLAEAGADIIELGMPFTDPVADGPTIQAASLRALEAGMSLKETLQMVRYFRTQNNKTPLVLMGYFNPVYRYGCEKFVRDAAEAGVDGLIIVDLPPEEDGDLRPYSEKAGIDMIRLVTPVTSEDRLAVLTQKATGFLYYVSITGVTGTTSADKSTVREHIQQIKTKTNLPIAVGFGIKSPQDVKDFAAFADAVVVGSSLVQEIEVNAAASYERIMEKVGCLRAAL